MRWNGIRTTAGRVSAVAGIVGLVAATAPAALVVETTQGSLKAKAEFAVSGAGAGRTLTITLSNTSANDVLVPADVLTALYFKTDGVAANAIVAQTANLAGGSAIHFETPSFGGTDLGGEWAYKEGFSLFGGNVDRGISTAGFGIFGPSNLFGGPDRNAQQALNGLDYGILSLGDNITTGNAPVKGASPLVQSSAVFTFNVPASFGESNILGDSVVFQYGTALDEPSFGPGVPEPTSALTAGLGALALGMRRRTKRRG